MKLKEIMQLLEEFCPRSFAMSWDNVGLQVGYADKEVKTIALAVDATSEVIAEAASHGADLILTHHPLLFGGVPCTQILTCSVWRTPLQTCCS